MIQLALCPAAELQKFFPVLLEEEQNPGNHRILRPLRITKGVAVHMDMQTAGACLMAGIAHINRTMQNLLPRHFFPVVIQRHGVRYHFKTIVQRTVMLTVEIFQAVAVGDLHDLTGTGIILPGPVNLQLHAKIPGAISTE